MMYIKDLGYKRKLKEKVDVGGAIFEYTRTLACLPLDIEQQYFNKVKLRMEEFKEVHHVNFNQTFEVVPVSQDYHMLVIQEHCKSKALREININLNWLQLFVRQMLDGLQFLNLNYPKVKYIGNLDLDTITICELSEDRNKFLIKLPYYYLNYITYDGTLLNFDHINIYYASPEWLFTILNYEQGMDIVLDFRSDLWSFGLIILEKMIDKHPLEYFFEIQYNYKVRDIDAYFECFIKLFEQTEFNAFIEFIKLKVMEKFNQEDKHKIELLIQFLESCLKWQIKDRLDLNQLLFHPFLIQQEPINPNPVINNKDLDDNQISLDETYYLLRINYTNLDLKLPNFNMFETKVNNFIHLNQKQLNLHYKYNDKLKLWDFNLSLLLPKLKQIEYLITEFNLEDEKSILFNFDYSKNYNNIHSNATYQFSRIKLFNKLILQYPQSKYEINYHAKYDIPHYYRNLVWACLLEVEGNYELEYNLLIKNINYDSDKQILVDLPRCHSYHTLLNSKSGQNSLNRIIKAFLNSNNSKVYWQGLDSIAATFLTINNMNEAIAYKSLNMFLDKHMEGYFNNNTDKSLNRTVNKYKVLLAYLDPILSNHLIHLDLNPTTYAVSWFLTLFTHVLSLDKIYLLFDKFLVFKLDYPIYFACSILIFKREFLLKSGFNECVSIFNHLNDLPFIKLLDLCHSFYINTPMNLLKFNTQLDAFSDSIDNNEQYLPTFMFELIHQYPIIILDLRSNDEFNGKHITKSYNVSCVLNGPNSIIHLLKIINKNQYNIIGLVSNDIEQLNSIGNFLILNNVSKVVRIQSPNFECNCESKALELLNKGTRNQLLLNEVVVCSK